MNFFIIEMRLSRLENAEEVAATASRIYAVLLASSISVLVLFNGLSLSTISVTVQSPTLATYETLQTQYSNVLSCSCKQIDVPYGTFLSMRVLQHQVKYAISEFVFVSATLLH